MTPPRRCPHCLTRKNGLHMAYDDLEPDEPMSTKAKVIAAVVVAVFMLVVATIIISYI